MNKFRILLLVLLTIFLNSIVAQIRLPKLISNVNALETSISNLTFAKGIILIQITGPNNKVVTRKLVN